MSAPLTASKVAALDGLTEVATEGRTAQQVMEDVLERIARAVAVSGFFAGATDPETGLCLTGDVYNYDHRVCRPFWENEFLVPDFNKFADLAPDRPVADLRRATGGKLERSARYRTLHDLSDLADEVRVVFHAGGRRWGQLQLNRHTGEAPFTDDELGFLQRAAPVIGELLRRTVLEWPTSEDGGRGPGVVLIGEDGHVVSITEEAEAWLGELSPTGWRGDDTDLLHFPGLYVAALSGLSDGPSITRRARMRTREGRWLIVQASSLPGTGQVVLVIEPAKASEVAPIIVDAYGLTPREVEVTQAVARGASTEQIASELCLSRHTIRDYLKSIFEKTGVSSRGELTSKLFAEHYKPAFDGSIYGAMDRVEARMSGLALET